MKVRRDLAGKVHKAAEKTQAATGRDRMAVAYIGLAGHRNLGDDAMFEAVRQLLPSATLSVNPKTADAVLVGGGTLLNADGYYLNRLRTVDASTTVAAVFGTGVRSLRFFGTTERYDQWDGFLRQATTVGVRGPDSADSLRTLGFEGEIDVIGDPALSLEAGDHTPVEGLVIVAPLHTDGVLRGGDDVRVLETLTSTVRRLRRGGHAVTLMSCHPNDDRWILEMMRDLADTAVGYLAGYDDLDATMATIASAELVIGERLHASVLAAAAETVFVAIEYRPKVGDFARSVGRTDAVVRTDEIERLDEVVDTVWNQRKAQVAEVREHVRRFRSLQRSMAAGFATAVAAAVTDQVE